MCTFLEGDRFYVSWYGGALSDGVVSGREAAGNNEIYEMRCARIFEHSVEDRGLGLVRHALTKC